jgi:hypothetical protein
MYQKKNITVQHLEWGSDDVQNNTYIPHTNDLKGKEKCPQQRLSYSSMPIELHFYSHDFIAVVRSMWEGLRSSWLLHFHDGNSLVTSNHNPAQVKCMVLKSFVMIE